jgi:hypothetical protein
MDHGSDVSVWRQGSIHIDNLTCEEAASLVQPGSALIPDYHIPKTRLLDIASKHVAEENPWMGYINYSIVKLKQTPIREASLPKKTPEGHPRVPLGA